MCFRSAAIGVALLMNHVLANHCFFGAWHLMLHNNEALFPTSEWSYFLCKTLQCVPSSASLKTKRVSSFTGQAKHRLIQKVLLLRCPFIGARVLHHLNRNASALIHGVSALGISHTFKAPIDAQLSQSLMSQSPMFHAQFRATSSLM